MNSFTQICESIFSSLAHFANTVSSSPSLCSRLSPFRRTSLPVHPSSSRLLAGSRLSNSHRQMILTHLILVSVALLLSLCKSSPVRPSARHRNILLHRISPRYVFDVPFTSAVDQPTIDTTDTSVATVTIEESPTYTTVEQIGIAKGSPTSNPLPAIDSTPNVAPQSLHNPSASANSTQPQEMLLSVLPSVFLFGRTYRFTFSSWASDTGLLVVGSVSSYVILYFERSTRATFCRSVD